MCNSIGITLRTCLHYKFDNLFFVYFNQILLCFFSLLCFYLLYTIRLFQEDVNAQDSISSYSSQSGSEISSYSGELRKSPLLADFEQSTKDMHYGTDQLPESVTLSNDIPTEIVTSPPPDSTVKKAGRFSVEKVNLDTPTPGDIQVTSKGRFNVQVVDPVLTNTQNSLSNIINDHTSDINVSAIPVTETIESHTTSLNDNVPLHCSGGKNVNIVTDTLNLNANESDFYHQLIKDSNTNNTSLGLEAEPTFYVSAVVDKSHDSIDTNPISNSSSFNESQSSMQDVPESGSNISVSVTLSPRSEAGGNTLFHDDATGSNLTQFDTSAKADDLQDHTVATWTSKIPITVMDENSPAVESLLTVSGIPIEISPAFNSHSNSSSDGHQQVLSSSFNAAYPSERPDSVMKTHDSSNADINSMGEYGLHSSVTSLITLKSVSSVTTVSSFPSHENTFTTKMIPTAPIVAVKPATLPVETNNQSQNSSSSVPHPPTITSSVTSVSRGVSPITILPISQQNTAGTINTQVGGVPPVVVESTTVTASMKNYTNTINAPLIAPIIGNPVLEFDPYVPAISASNMFDTFSQPSDISSGMSNRPDLWPLNYSGYSSSIPDSECSSRAGSPTQLTPAGSIENVRSFANQVQSNLNSITGVARMEENVSSLSLFDLLDKDINKVIPFSL